MSEVEKYKTSVVGAVHTLCELTKSERNGLWVKSEEHGRDVLVPHKYEQAFRWKINKTPPSSSSWTTEASRASAHVQLGHDELALMLAADDWSGLFPTMVATELCVRVLSPGSSDDNPHESLHMVYKEMQAASPMVAHRKFSVVRACLQINQATWVIAEISHVPSPDTNIYRRLPSGCVIEYVTDNLSKVTWVEHMLVADSLPNSPFHDHLFSFGAERIVAWLQRSCERWSHSNATSHLKLPDGTYAPWILEKVTLMDFGETMARALFQNVAPNHYFNYILWRSVTASEDLKVFAGLYNYSANLDIAGGVVTFRVTHSPEFVLDTLADEQTHRQWDVLGGFTKLYRLKKYSTGGDTRNNISAFMIEGSSNELLIKEVNVNPSGSLVLWSTVSMKDFDVMSRGQGLPEDPVLISGFSITANGHTAATNTGGSVITLVLRKLVDGNQPLQEKGQQSIESITSAINQTVVGVKEALQKRQPPSPGGTSLSGDWPTEKQQVGADDFASEIMQAELEVLKLN